MRGTLSSFDISPRRERPRADFVCQLEHLEFKNAGRPTTAPLIRFALASCAKGEPSGHSYRSW
jgi:hypothetical protein